MNSKLKYFELNVYAFRDLSENLFLLIETIFRITRQHERRKGGRNLFLIFLHSIHVIILGG